MINFMCFFYLGVVREDIFVIQGHLHNHKCLIRIALVLVSLRIRSIISLLRARFARGHTVLFVVCTIKSDENCANFKQQFCNNPNNMGQWLPLLAEVQSA